MTNTVKIIRERNYRVMFEYHNLEVIAGTRSPYGKEKTFWMGTDQDFDNANTAKMYGVSRAKKNYSNYPPTGKFKVVRTDTMEIRETWEVEYKV